MTTPTTNYGWPRPLNTDMANIAGINTCLDAVDTSLNDVAVAIEAVIKPMGMMKMVARIYTIYNLTQTYLTGAGSWEQKWFVNGNVVGTTGQPIVMNTDGTWQVTAAGVYRLTYTLNFLCHGTVSEGFWRAIVVDNATNTEVPRTRQQVRMVTHVSSFQTMHMTTLLRATTGGDIALDTLYKFGLTHDADVGVYLGTRYDQADHFYSYYTLEYVRGL